MRMTSFKYTALTLGMTLVLSACGGGGGNKSKAVSTSGSTTESVNASSAQVPIKQITNQKIPTAVELATELANGAKAPQNIEERLGRSAQTVRENGIALRQAETAMHDHTIEMSRRVNPSPNVLAADRRELARLIKEHKKAVEQFNASRASNTRVIKAVRNGCFATASPGGNAECIVDENGTLHARSSS